MKKIIILVVIAMLVKPLAAGIVISGCKVNTTGNIALNVLDNNNGIIINSTAQLNLAGNLTTDGYLENQGSFTMTGDLIADNYVKNQGTFGITGNLNTPGYLETQESFEMEGNLTIGEYLKNEGAFSILGNLTTGGSLENQGSFTMDGDLITNDYVKSLGSFHITGDFNTLGYLETQESFEMEGNLAIGEYLKNEGTFYILGNLTTGGSLENLGSFTINGDLIADDHVKSQGSFHITGDFNTLGYLETQESFEMEGNLTIGEYLKNEGTFSILGNLTNGGYLENQNSFLMDGAITVNGNLLNNGTFTLPNGSSLLNGGSISGTGLFKVEQTVEDNLIHYFSSPVSLENTSVFNLGFVNKFDEQQNKWVAMENIETLQVGSGYAVQFLTPPTVVFEGMVNNGNQDINCTNIRGGWNLIGNPYPSAIDFDAPGWTKSIIDNTLYFWNGVNYSYYLVPGGNPPEGNLYVNNGTNIIPSRQGFFVKCNTNGMVGMTNAVRIHDNTTPFYKNGAKSGNLPYVKLLASGNGFTDEMMVGFHASATRHFDGNFDAFKLWSTHEGVPQLASVIPETSEQLAINLCPELEKDMVVPLIFKSSLAGNYTISISDLNLNNNLWIEDTNNGESRPVSAGSPYLFHYSTPNNEKSFNLHFKEGQLGITEANVLNCLVTCGNGEIVITTPGSSPATELNVSVYDIMGRVMMQTNARISGHSVQIPVSGFTPGVYIVKIISSENQLYTSKVTLH